jgi:hypothetical protein
LSADGYWLGVTYTAADSLSARDIGFTSPTTPTTVYCGPSSGPMRRRRPTGDPEAYDEFGGKERGWQNLLSPNLLDLLSVRFLTLQEERPLPGFHKVVGPIASTLGTPAVLYERDSIAPYARVFAAAVKVPEGQQVAALTNPRFPAGQLILVPDTLHVQIPPVTQPVPRSRVTATVTEWAPGAIRVRLQGRDSAPSFLLISENWYPDWKATVDGVPSPVIRADHTLLSVLLPPGAKEVRLRFHSAMYDKGKAVSVVFLVLALGMVVVPLRVSFRTGTS